MKVGTILLAGLLATTGSARAAQHNAYHIASEIQVGGSGHWDYLVDDSQHHRLYMSHNVSVEVVDTAAGHKVGSLKIGGFTHGMAIALDAGRGYVATGKSFLSTEALHEVVEFDLKTLAIVRRIAVAAEPDGLVYEPRSRSVVAFSPDSKSATVIDTKTGRVVKTINLEGSPEGSVADGKGNIFVNLSDTNQIVKIETPLLAVRRRWSLAGCDGPSSLALDRATRRLFAACDNKVLDVVNADNGMVVAKLPVAPRNDGVVYDPATHTIFVATLSGTLSILRETSADHSVPVQTLQTLPGSRTIALDLATHTVYLSAAKFGHRKKGQKYPDPIDGTFRALVVTAEKT